MYISTLIISNFRAFKTLGLNFNKGVNIIIGENNAGKSAIIDALRICLGYGKSDQILSIKETDLYINAEDANDKSTYV